MLANLFSLKESLLSNNASTKELPSLSSIDVLLLVQQIQVSYIPTTTNLVKDYIALTNQEDTMTPTQEFQELQS